LLSLQKSHTQDIKTAVYEFCSKLLIFFVYPKKYFHIIIDKISVMLYHHIEYIFLQHKVEVGVCINANQELKPKNSASNASKNE